LSSASGQKAGELKSIHSDGSGYFKTLQFENTASHDADQYIYDYQFLRYSKDHSFQWQVNILNKSLDLQDLKIVSQSEKYIIISNNSQNFVEQWFDPTSPLTMNYSWNFGMFSRIDGNLQNNITMNLQKTIVVDDTQSPIFYGSIELLPKGLIVGNKFVIPELATFEYMDGRRPTAYFSILQFDMDTNQTARRINFQIIDRIEFDYSLQLDAGFNQVDLIVAYTTPIQFSGRGYAFDRYIEHHEISVTQSNQISSSGWSVAKSRCQHEDCHGFYDGKTSIYYFYEQVEEDNLIIDRYSIKQTTSKNVIIPEHYRINLKKYLFLTEESVLFPGEVFYEDESTELDLFLLSLGSKYKIEQLFLLQNIQLDLKTITDLFWIGEDIGVAINGRHSINNAETSVHEIFIIPRNVFNVRDTLSKYPYIPNIVLTLVFLIPIFIRFPREKKGEITPDQYPSLENSK
jgi:hypothetical protein